jgi:hypothetical protein
MAKLMKVERHKSNPFTRPVINTKKKMVMVSNGKQLVDTNTGEIENITHIVSYKEVDNEEYIKFYTGNIALTFDLTSAGNKAFIIILVVTQKEAIGKDEIYINDEVAVSYAEELDVKISASTFRRGIKELINKQIIAKSTKTNIYFINPNLIFNGDRVAFTQAVSKRKINSAEEQLEMFDDKH